MKRITFSCSLWFVFLLGVAAPLWSSHPAFCAPHVPQIPALNCEQRSDWTSVKDFGAKGDGVADDTAAIQKAFDGFKEGATIYLPAGTYRITQSLNLRGPAAGGQLIGHGRDTKLVWDGEDGGKLLIVDGIANALYSGFILEGNNKAAFGLYYYQMRRFQTESRHQHIAFQNFTEAGLATDDKDNFANAETLIENCLFLNCESGARFHSFNDYNWTFTGCEFQGCGIGIDSNHGNFYARDCHFENSETVDIKGNAEHNSSVRRCTSVGSEAFLVTSSTVAAVTVQDCRIDSWQSPNGAILLGSAPAVMFDNVFTNPPSDQAPVRAPHVITQIITSENSAPQSKEIIQAANPQFVHVIPAGNRQRSKIVASDSFLKESVAIPGRVFDAKRDFGAKGEYLVDDTKAIQATIDAARAYGKGAVAYLPQGTYFVSSTLNITGSDYYVAGSGFRTGLSWTGDKDGTIISVHDTRNVTMQQINVGSHDVGNMENAVDIVQTGSTNGSNMTYDGVYVFGMYQKLPLRKGLEFRGLGKSDTVVISHLEGNIRFIDSAQATFLGNATYEGSVTISGKDKRRDGFIGFQTRLATVVTHGLYIRDNHSFVASDFYIEESDDGMVFDGEPGDPPGRVTVAGAKLHVKDNPETPAGDVLDIYNYEGQIFFGPYQFYPGSKAVRFHQKGDRPVDIFLNGVSCYEVIPAVDMEGAGNVHASGTLIVTDDATKRKGATEELNGSAPSPQTLASFSKSLDDLRQLGQTDLRLNYPKQARDY